MTRNKLRREEAAFDAAQEALDDDLRGVYLDEVGDRESAPSFEEWKRARTERATTDPAPEDQGGDIPF